MITFLGVVIGFLGTEFLAWAAHKYLMHGFLWNLHEDHHKPDGNFFQKNDLFFLVFAIPSWLCIMLGVMYKASLSVGIGSGIAVFGVVYFLIHDVLIHRRFNWFDNWNNSYFNAIKKAHRIHHEVIKKEGGQCFGLLYIPRKYWK